MEARAFAYLLQDGIKMIRGRETIQITDADSTEYETEGGKKVSVRIPLDGYKIRL